MRVTRKVISSFAEFVVHDLFSFIGDYHVH